jgi:hypothetical protein
MGNPQFDSILARKLSTFLPLFPDELKRLAEMQSTPLKVKRGKQLTQEGQSGTRPSFSRLAGRAVTRTCRTVAARSSRFR